MALTLARLRELIAEANAQQERAMAEANACAGAIQAYQKLIAEIEKDEKGTEE